MKYERGTYPRGFNIPCKHCNQAFSWHFANLVQRGICQGGYEPNNKQQWEIKEAVYQTQRKRLVAERQI